MLIVTLHALASALASKVRGKEEEKKKKKKKLAPIPPFFEGNFGRNRFLSVYPMVRFDEAGQAHGTVWC
jgi:hypothetical protein